MMYQLVKLLMQPEYDAISGTVRKLSRFGHDDPELWNAPAKLVGATYQKQHSSFWVLPVSNVLWVSFCYWHEFSNEIKFRDVESRLQGF